MGTAFKRRVVMFAATLCSPAPALTQPMPGVLGDMERDLQVNWNTAANRTFLHRQLTSWAENCEQWGFSRSTPLGDAEAGRRIEARLLVGGGNAVGAAWMHPIRLHDRLVPPSMREMENQVRAASLDSTTAEQARRNFIRARRQGVVVIRNTCRSLASDPFIRTAYFTGALRPMTDAEIDEDSARVFSRLTGIPVPALTSETASPVRSQVQVIAPIPPRLRSGSINNSDYPSSAARAGASGTTRFNIQVGVDGIPTGCSIVGSSGYSSLDSTFCSLAVRRYRFDPATINGQPVAGVFAGAFRWVAPDE